MSYGYGVPAEKNAIIELIHHAYTTLGVTFFNTAEYYGSFTNEELVGDALKPIHNTMKIATNYHCS